MKKTAAVLAGAALLALGLAQATPAAAATTWDFASGSFTLSDVAGGTATLRVQNVQVTGSSASGRLELTNGPRYTCSTSDFSGLTATFTTGMYNPCHGTVTFAVDGTGVLSVASSAVYIPTQYLTGPATGTIPGAARPPVWVPLANCTATTDVPGQAIEFAWTDNPDATEYELAVSGLTAPITLAPGTSGGVDFSVLSPGTAYTAKITAKRADGQTVADCTTTSAWTPPAAPAIGSTVAVEAGGLLTVNYNLPDPTGVQGIEYRLDGGAWLRPGGAAPVNGTGGSFTLRGLTAKSATITLRTVGDNLGGPLTTAGSPTTVTFSKTPSTTVPGTAAGSTPSKPVPTPPATPVTTVPGTSNGAGTGTNGALAAGTGDAGIDAPCLAQDGTLYPNQYSTVGSQLTMAPNTHGLGTAKSFAVINGALPPGMQLDRTYGVLFGVTSQAGSWMTTIRATFADGSRRTGQFTTRVDADPQTLQYAAQNIGTVGRSMSIAPTTNAPAVGTTYTLVCGKLPTGTRLDSTTGRILGRPTTVVARPTPLRIAETSSSGKAAASFIFVVNRAGTTSISYPAHPHVRTGKRVAIRPTVTGVGDIALFRMWKGKLPRGLHLNHRTGVVTGRIAHGGPTHTITIVAVTKGGALLTAAPMKLRLRR